MQNTLFAGLSSMDITPPRGMELAGYPHHPRHNTGTHDPLFATCMYLSEGDVQLAIVGVDLLFFSRKHVLDVQARLRAVIGLSPEELMICCSHSHSSPWAAGRLDMEALVAGVKQDEGYIRELKDKIVMLVVSASRTAFPAQIGYAHIQCGRELGIGGNRRDPVDGLCDPNAYVLCVRDLDGIERGLLVNYAVHPTLLHADNLLCSADYPGYMRSFLREKHPHATMVFALGASGDQSSRYFRDGQTFSEARRFGRTIGGAVSEAVSRMIYVGDVALHAASIAYDPALRALPSEGEARRHVAECKARYEALVRADAPYVERQNANVALLGAEDMLGYVLMKKRGVEIELCRDELPAALSLTRIGDICICALPGEVFAGIALALRAQLGEEKLIINTVSNGCLPGYLYTRDDEAQGGYEVDTSLLDASAGEQLITLMKALCAKRLGAIR